MALRVSRGAGLALLLLVLGGGLGWAASNVFATPPLTAVRDSTTVRVERGSVASAYAVNVRAAWPRTPVPTGMLAGTVTSISGAESEMLASGDTVLTLSLNPVFVIEGSVPSFRDMSEGMRGEDVAQLQAHLESHRYLWVYTPGVWEYATTEAVRAWQRDVGTIDDGIVSASDVVFVESLPARFSLDRDVVRLGATLTGGEEFLYRLEDSPTFEVPLTDTQAAATVLGTQVSVSAPNGGEWEAWIVDARSDSAEGGTTLVLHGATDLAEERNICGDECGSVPIDSEGVLLRSRVISVPEQTGLIVPTAAITTNPRGETVLIAESGEELTVTVVAGAQGMALVEGVAAGTRVLAPAGGSRGQP